VSKYLRNIETGEIKAYHPRTAGGPMWNEYVPPGSQESNRLAPALAEQTHEFPVSEEFSVPETTIEPFVPDELGGGLAGGENT